MRETAIILISLSMSVLNVRAEDIEERLCPEGMVYVPAGRFVMGSRERKDERPTRTVNVNAFYIDQYPVTNAQFKAFVDATGYRTFLEEVGRAIIPGRGGRFRRVVGAYWRAPEGPGSTIEGRMDHPVIHIGYRDAEAYCRWAGKRLPREAEWEKACRGMDGRKFPWGNDWKEGRYTSTRPKSLHYHRTSPVGRYPYGSSPYGAIDMVGNIWQWTSDDFRPNDRQIFRVMKGDPWGSPPRCSRRRLHEEDDTMMLYMGFRCAKDVRW